MDIRRYQKISEWYYLPIIDSTLHMSLCKCKKRNEEVCKSWFRTMFLSLFP